MFKKCLDCGTEIKADHNARKYCADCRKEHLRQNSRRIGSEIRRDHDYVLTEKVLVIMGRWYMKNVWGHNV